MNLEGALLKVWRSTMVEDAPAVELEGQAFPVRITAKKRLRQVDFVFHRQELRGLEQNPETGSQWAELARRGHQVMQFLSAGRYVANVVDGKVTLYGGKSNRQRPARMKPK
jgi:hypothetical protein